MHRMQTGFFTDEWCFWHSTGLHANVLAVGGWVQVPSSTAHAESPESKRRLKNLIEVSGLAKSLDYFSAEALDSNTLKMIHSKEYLQRFQELSESSGGEISPSATLGPGSFEIAKLSAGLAADALDKVYTGELTNAYSLSRPPGHHCLPDQAMGFCFLANIPLAIERTKRRHALGKVAVIDWDVHHGNGTQHIYYHRNDVLTISLHQDKCFPPGYSGAEDIGTGDGEGYNINIPLQPGCGHEAYLHAFESIVIPALHKFKPEIIIVACGYDANAFDPLARLLLHSETFRQMTALTKRAAEQLCQGKLVIVHEGGYAESYVPFCGLAVLEELTGLRTTVTDPCLELLQMQQPSTAFNQFQIRQLDDQAKFLKSKNILD